MYHFKDVTCRPPARVDLLVAVVRLRLSQCATATRSAREYCAYAHLVRSPRVYDRNVSCHILTFRNEPRAIERVNPYRVFEKKSAVRCYGARFFSYE